MAESEKGKGRGKREDDDKKFRSEKKKGTGGTKKYIRKKAYKDKARSGQKLPKDEGQIRLNKYIAHAGICSRREADTLIESGAVEVNGKVVTELGTKVLPTDDVKVGNQGLSLEKKVYVLVNKPKDYITTVSDPRNRKTVLHLIQGACKERVYPVGRLDRNTTGVLLLTNDGDLTKRLTHPKHGVKKIYQVTTGQKVSKNDLIKLVEGVELEDGRVYADVASYVGDASDKREIGIELHSGKNRVIRRMFEKLGYKVIKLDRVAFAGLTKKNLPRGKWRLLTEKEVGILYRQTKN